MGCRLFIRRRNSWLRYKIWACILICGYSCICSSLLITSPSCKYNEQIYRKMLWIGRPTIFLEIIQRVGCMVKDEAGRTYQKGGCGGFGKGNFTELFKSIEEYEKSLEAKANTKIDPTGWSLLIYASYFYHLIIFLLSISSIVSA